MPTNNLAEEDDVIENDTELQNNTNQLPTSAKSNRTNFFRVIGKESTDENELETITCPSGNLLSNQRSSNRLTKRLRRETSPVDAILKKTAAKPSTSSIGSKTRRPWELWSVEDKNSFFEALCEYGKDFESIQSHIAQRSKKKGTAASMIKNKDQVRHFYYRTWHKISKFLEISESVRKQTQELYGLINYAELRKKIGGLNEKNSQKLNELVFNGVTTVKHKGKKLRIKTPVCRALKKLNNVSDTNAPEPDKMPKDIIVEFRPHTNFAWHQVQALSQNPRIRTKVGLQKRLRPVLEHLQNRWRPNRLRRKELIMTSLPPSSTEENSCDPLPVLRVKPGRGTKISLLSLSAMNIASSSDVCLQKYLKYAQKTLFGGDMAKNKNVGPKSKVTNDNNLIVANIHKEDLIDDLTTFNVQESVPQGCISEISESPVKISSDEGFIGILTPPKSVPEHEIGSEQSFHEAQKSLSLLSSMQTSSNIKNSSNTCQEEVISLHLTDASVTKSTDLFDETSKKSDECTENPMDANCDSKTNAEMESNVNNEVLKKVDAACYNHSEEQLTQIRFIPNEEELAQYNQQDGDACESNVLNQSHNKNSEDHALEPDSNQCTDQCEDDISGVIDLGKFSKDDEIAFQKAMKQGWTAEEAEFLTFGELYLMFGHPSKIVLEYEFQQSDEIEKSTLNDAEVACTNTDGIAEMSKMLENMFRYACGAFSDDKNKHLPLSPTSRNVFQSRVNAASKTSGKETLRNSIKYPTLKSSLKTKPCTLSDNAISSSESSFQLSKEDITNNPELNLTGSKIVAASSDSSDQHVFVMPVGTAPRAVKPPNQESLREEIGKLLPGTRRGCRVRRKPLVVQKPLLPRDGMRTISGPRPMTVVHFVPSGSQLTAVIPSNCSGAENKISLPSANKVVKILSTGSPIDMHPLQVPVKQVCSDSSKSIMLQTNSTASSQVVLNPSHKDSFHLINNQNISCAMPLLSSSETIKHAKSNEVSSMLDSHHSAVNCSLPSKNVDIPSSTSEDSRSNNPVPSLESEISSCSSSDLSPTVVSSFLKEPLSKGFQLCTTKDKSSALSLSGNPSLDSDPAFSSEQNTPPDSPPHQPFRINSPEIQWLNGESAELSLNTFLNAMESPNKMSASASSVNLAPDNSNLDPIVRLAPVVDSQVRCLLDECSIDFIAKFEDLADVINSSSNDSKPS